jgi:hypothetical protein
MIEAVTAFTEKLYERYGKVYASWLLAMLSAPSSVVAKTRDVLKEESHGEYIVTILTISIAFGVTVGALIPNRPEISSRAVVFIVVSLLWLFLSLLVHGFCRLVGGKEAAQMTISLMLQNLAFAYVASNFLTLLIIWCTISYPPVQRLLGDRALFHEPGGLLFSFQFLILLFLVPLTVSYAHGFRGFRWFGVALFSAAFAILFGFPVYAQHSC